MAERPECSQRGTVGKTASLASDPRHTGRSPRAVRDPAGRNEPGLHVANLLVVRLWGLAQPPVTGDLPLPVVYGQAEYADANAAWNIG